MNENRYYSINELAKSAGIGRGTVLRNIKLLQKLALKMMKPDLIQKQGN